jgi:hypothetical protein
MRRFVRFAIAGVVGATLLGGGLQAASAAGTSTISGVAFQDLNRNGVQDSGEAPFSGHRLYLFDGARTAYLGTTVTDDTGRYSFTGLTDGSYGVEYESGSWSAIRDSWVPTTTGSIYPRLTLDVRGTARGDFGWRQLVRSTTAGAPISSATATNGAKVESYNDAVSASEVATALAASSLLGAEGPATTVRFGLGSSDVTSSSVLGSAGSYHDYQATSYITWGSWLGTGTRTLFHEYGHAWSGYFSRIAQQDGTLSGYLPARGLAGDSRIGSSSAWSPEEMIAEDFRELFGSAEAAGYQQMNRDIPPAADVPGLRDYLAGAFRASATSPAPQPAAAPAAPLNISGLAVNPQTVTKTGTVGFTISAPATVTVEIQSGGKLVRSLLASSPKDAGNVSVVWDRLDSAGRRAKTGSYTAVVTASDGSSTTTASAPFKVS